jgi:hypothetical protein
MANKSLKDRLNQLERRTGDKRSVRDMTDEELLRIVDLGPTPTDRELERLATGRPLIGTRTEN